MNADQAISDTGPAAVTARGLTLRYPGSHRAALNGLDLDLYEGEIFGLLGPNGAGKTTTIAILSTILDPDAGAAVVNGFDLRREKRFVRRMIGVVPQEVALYPSLTARENLRFFGKLHALKGGRLDRCIDDALSAVGLASRADQRIAAYSGGMKRRANLAAGILHQPRILFLDEPTVGIDAQSRRLILDRIAALRDRGTTVLYTTHYMEEAQQLCSRVAIMDRGRIMAQGTVDQLLARRPECGDLGTLFLELTGKALRDA